MVDWSTAAIAVLLGTLSACFALLIVRIIPTFPGYKTLRRAEVAPVEPIILLFSNKQLVDATGSARTLLDALPGEDEWSRLWVWLSQRFADLDCLFEQVAKQGSATIEARPGSGAAALRLRAEDLGKGVLRLEIVDPSLEHAGITVNSHSLAAMEDELGVLRESVDHAPVLIWREDPSGTVTWANAAYLREIEAQAPDEVRWPLPRLISLPDDAGAVRRAQIELADHERWFDCHLQIAEEHRTIFAVPADNAVRAERSLREFVQTLTKTFADLHIGLAIFDRERRLQLFNPALIDLTGLRIDFLTARPTLYALLDALRESRMVPEPKDFASWRQSMATLEAGAASGHHVETWTLPGGQTYRVTGRPHPDGAIAFLFEDISSEIALTRRFKAELSLGAEVLDALDSAVAIFDADGRPMTTNQQFNVLWGTAAAMSLRGYDDLWRRVAESSPGYQALRTALAGVGPNSRRNGVIAGPDGTLLSWRVRPLSGGRRMVLFASAVASAEPSKDSTPHTSISHPRPSAGVA